MAPASSAPAICPPGSRNRSSAGAARPISYQAPEDKKWLDKYR
jgi:hypothetical protein